MCWANGAPHGEAQLIAVLHEEIVAEQATARRRLERELEGLGHVHRSTAPLHGRVGFVAVAYHLYSVVVRCLCLCVGEQLALFQSEGGSLRTAKAIESDR